MAYYFKAAQHFDAVSNFESVLKCTGRARELLLIHNHISDLDSEQRLFLSRIDILVFKAKYETMIEDRHKNSEAQINLSAAINFLCEGYECGGGLCGQVTQACGLLVRHSMLMRDKGKAEAAKRADKSPEYIAAIRECYHILRPLQIEVNTGFMKGIPIASPALAFISLGYLRMRLAFFLNDDVLLGVSFAFHSAVMMIAGLPQYAHEYLEHAERLNKDQKSDYMRAYVLAAENVLGLYSNAEVGKEKGIESVALAKQLQIVTLLRQQMNFSVHAAFNAGAFRSCWRMTRDYYALSLEESNWTHFGRAVYVRVGLLCILNNPERAVGTAEHLLSVGNNVMKQLGYDQFHSPVNTLAFFRSGREEDTNARVERAIEETSKNYSGPWFLTSIHSFCTVIYEMYCKAVALRKKSKIDRLKKAFREVLSSLERHVKTAVANVPYLIYWRGMFARMDFEETKAEALFDVCVAMCASAPGVSKYPAALAKLVRVDSSTLENADDKSADVIKELVRAGDLHSLSLLNNKGVEGSAEAYNKVLEEPDFFDLFGSDRGGDERSVAHTSLSSHMAGESLFLSFAVGSSGENGDSDGGEQDLLGSVFTGRKEELKAFKAMAKTLIDSNGKHAKSAYALLAIVGPSGIGKTALLDEMGCHVDRDEIVVLRGSCTVGERQTAYFPFREVFSVLFGTRRSGSIKDRTKALLSCIEDDGFFRTIPHRSLLKAVLAVNISETQATCKMKGRTRAEATVKCLVRFLAARSFTKKILILIDDIQWMDADSFALLESILEVSGIGVVVTSRSDSSPEESHFRKFISASKKIELQPFNMKETEEFFIERFELDAIDPHVLSFCHLRAGGVPATLECLLSTLMENHIFSISEDRVLELNDKKVRDPSQLEKLETPDSVRELIRSQMAKLNPSCLDLLFLASTIGFYFSLGLLEEAYKQRPTVSGTTLPRKVLKTLVNARVLLLDHDESHVDQKAITFHFSSSETQRAVYGMQSDAGRQINHLCVAQALEAMLLTGSFRNDGTSRTASNQEWKAGKSRRRRSRRRGSIVPPQERHVKTVDILPKIASHLKEANKRLKSLDFFFRAGRAMSEQGLEGAIDMFRSCLELSDSLGDDVSTFMRAEYLFYLASDLMEVARSTEAANSLKDALELLGEEPDPSTWDIATGICALLFPWCCLCWNRGIPADAEKEEELKLSMLSTLMACYASAGKTKEAVHALIRGNISASRIRVTTLTKIDTIEALSELKCGWSIFCLLAGMSSTAKTALLESLELCKMAAGGLSLRHNLTQSNTLLSLGMWTEARPILATSISEAEELGSRYYHLANSFLKIQLLCHLLELEEAASLQKQMMGLYREEQDFKPQWKAWVMVNHALLHVYLGAFEDLKQSVWGGEEAMKVYVVKDYQKTVGKTDWKGEVHVLALAWLGEHGRAAAMTIGMLGDDRAG